MALTPQTRVRQARIIALGRASPDVRIGQAQVIALVRGPAAHVRIGQAQAVGLVKAALDLRIAQAQVIALVRGRPDDYELRAWTFDLDGHSFYVLKLGRQGTVVFDLATGQWSDWRSHDLAFWRAMTGMNWLGIGSVTMGNGFAGNVVVGDDTHGLLWLLEPAQGYDDHPRDGGGVIAIRRRAMGQLPMRGRNVARCNGVYVTGSLGRPAIGGAEVILSTSDDEGRNWHEHGAITVTPGDYSQQFSWRSMGRVRAPGRLFQVYDDGAMQRIDGLDMLPDDQ